MIIMPRFTTVIILFVFLVSACVADPYYKEFMGQPFNFRADLSIAEKVPLERKPGINLLRFTNAIERIHVAYYADTADTNIYGVAVVELGSKLASFYGLQFGYLPEITLLPLSNSSELDSYNSPIEPVILLLGEDRTNMTSVGLLNDNVVLLQGKSFDLANRKYTDLDSAVARLILSLMEG